MAFRLRPRVKETLGLTDEQCRHIAQRGGTSLTISVKVNLTKAGAAAVGATTSSGEGGGFTQLARCMDPDGRKGAGVYDHIDRDQFNYREGNLRRVTYAENCANKDGTDDLLVFMAAEEAWALLATLGVTP